MDKKGQLGNLYQYVMVFVLVGIVLAVGLIVLSEFSGSLSGTPGAQGAVNDTIDALVPIASDWMPILVIVAVVGIILSLVIGAFAFYRNRG